MNKQEIINHIADEHGISKVAAKAIFELIFEDIVKTIESKKADNKMKLPGFGVISIQKRPARDGINPKTKQKIKIPAKQVVKFKASKTLLDRIN